MKNLRYNQPANAGYRICSTPNLRAVWQWIVYFSFTPFRSLMLSFFPRSCTAQCSQLFHPAPRLIRNSCHATPFRDTVQSQFELQNDKLHIYSIVLILQIMSAFSTFFPCSALCSALFSALCCTLRSGHLSPPSPRTISHIFASFSLFRCLPVYI